MVSPCAALGGTYRSTIAALVDTTVGPGLTPPVMSVGVCNAGLTATVLEVGVRNAPFVTLC